MLNRMTKTAVFPFSSKASVSHLRGAVPTVTYVSGPDNLKVGTPGRIRTYDLLLRRQTRKMCNCCLQESTAGQGPV